jgi:hypothetical protein
VRNNEGSVTKITYITGPTALIEIGGDFSPIQHSIRLTQTTSQPRNSLVPRSVRGKSDALLLCCFIQFNRIDIVTIAAAINRSAR